MFLPSRIWAWIALATAAAAAFSLSCAIADAPGREPARTAEFQDMEKVLASGRFALSSSFFEMADIYFHKGVDHVEKRAFEGGFFQSLAKDLCPEHVVHLAGQDMKEMMPWIWLAIRADPKNLNAYLSGAFLLSRELGRTDLAHELLREAQLNIPGNYEARLEDARVYMKERDLPAARHALDAAVAFWPGNRSPTSNEATEDKATLLLYRGLLRESTGDIDSAIADYQEVLALFPDRNGLRSRISNLRGGSPPSVLATRLWHDTLQEQDKQEGVCRGHEDREH